jgi:hypothetical protein
MKPWIRKAHRWLGLAFSLTLLMSSGSGVIHTIMSRTQAPPPAARPAGGGLDAAAIRLSPLEAIARIPAGKSVAAINLRSIGGQPCYQIFTADGAIPTYISAVMASPIPNLTKCTLRKLLRHFSAAKR